MSNVGKTINLGPWVISKGTGINGKDRAIGWDGSQDLPTASVYVPDTISTIETGCFSRKEKIKRIDFKYTEQINELSCNEMPNLAAVYLRPNTVNIGYSAFEGCEKLSTIKWDWQYHDTPRCIMKAAFAGTGIKFFDWPENCHIIDAKMFANCKQLEAIHIPADVDSIWSDAFEGCENLGVVRFESDKQIGLVAQPEKIFKGCNKLYMIRFKTFALSNRTGTWKVIPIKEDVDEALDLSTIPGIGAALDGPVYYNGSSKYKESFANNNHTVWLTDDKLYAKSYALGDSDKGYLYTCNIKKLKLLDVGDSSYKVFVGNDYSEAFLKVISKLDISLAETKKLVSDAAAEMVKGKKDLYVYTILRSNAFRDIAKNLGYDGIKAVEYNNSGNRYSDTIGVFDGRNITIKDTQEVSR